MSSPEDDLQSILGSIQSSNYLSLLIVTAIVYDYVLNFAREIDYVWGRPWSWVSTVYVLVRYIGLYWGIISGLAGSTFIPGPATVSAVIFLVCAWAFPVFLGAADSVMIARVYMMWNRSRIVLCTLIFMCILQIITVLVFAGVYNHPGTSFTATVSQVLDLEFCNYVDTASINTNFYFTLPRFIFSVTLLVFALTKTLRQLVNYYRATNQWESTELMKRLVQDGIFYFTTNAIFNTIVVLEFGPDSSDFAIIFLQALSFVILCPLIPRFIISLRELYDRAGGVDTAFGVPSPLNFGEDVDASISGIALAEVSPREGAVAARGEVDTELEVVRHTMTSEGARPGPSLG